ncbi:MULTISPECIES: regulatory protein RecX [Edwardsiella]|uniref:Regulatory protein RecX n=2 Tax=Edwardsiella anguillarum TaxID=1821960 RepID=A0A076LGA6_9GAMM|nr:MULTISPECIES: regulatory protein RecX [Edwardsiella]AKM46956.1 RecX family transcriptional regulator [Edwardsiella sp. EA181011]GAJ68239.1 regulatory protein RecX [Edwardsiella piscicida]AIJ07545.1 regulatory protein RecX, putative [Edwardsiella anguillarum ET080813]AKR78750.1 recombination regulator RecX [Edwardsiella sp. LADL05-105]KAB0591527.1 regulatory protein RecX [Edwardsiella anguillarum]
MSDALNRAMRLLAQRDHSENELRRKLAAQGVSEGEIALTIAHCQRYQWLDDARFAQRYIESRSRKGYGAQRVRQELGVRGVARDLIQQALAECEIDWSAQARRALERHFSLPLSPDWATRVKVQRYLLYRGFFSEEIQDALRDLTS